MVLRNATFIDLIKKKLGCLFEMRDIFVIVMVVLFSKVIRSAMSFVNQICT